MYVQGPFKSHGVAESLAKSQTGVKLTAVGSAYVVIAPLGVHLNAQVGKVASCLTGTANGKGGTYSF